MSKSHTLLCCTHLGCDWRSTWSAVNCWGDFYEWICALCDASSAWRLKRGTRQSKVYRNWLTYDKYQAHWLLCEEKSVSLLRIRGYIHFYMINCCQYWGVTVTSVRTLSIAEIVVLKDPCSNQLWADILLSDSLNFWLSDASKKQGIKFVNCLQM